MLGDLVRRPLLKEIEVEREVILEEILDEIAALLDSALAPRPLRIADLPDDEPQVEPPRRRTPPRRTAAGRHERESS